MPLRDHFRPPVRSRHAWNELHGMWPAIIVQQLYAKLPEGYVAAPSVHLGAEFEVDIAAFEKEDAPVLFASELGGGLALATQAPTQPTLTIETDLSDPDEFEVRIYDDRMGRTLVAAIELISPSNKDRPASRRAFVGKVEALLQQNVCVSLVDVVTTRDFNLYADLLELVGGSDPLLGPEPPILYAVTIRCRKRPRRRSLLESWFYPMHAGQPLPNLPICLDVDLNVMLDLEAAYEETCRFLRIS